jgi:hypothetical protein
MLNWKKDLSLPTVAPLSVCISSFYFDLFLLPDFPLFMSVFTLISSPNHSDWLWRSLYLLLNGWRGVKSLEPEADQSRRSIKT